MKVLIKTRNESKRWVSHKCACCGQVKLFASFLAAARYCNEQGFVPPYRLVRVDGK